jgi:superfamily II DNA or RNA helicase
MQNLQTHLAGQPVEARGESWMVVRADPYDTCTIVTLRGTGDANFGRTTELIAPFDRVTATTRSARVQRASRRAVLNAAAAAVARAHAWMEAWTAATARIDLLPWQLEPAMAAVAGATRLLLADGVGLGKTIQAGLILAELRARGLVGRALVLTPASLREQWAAELGDRFALAPLVLDHAVLTRLAAELPPDVNPWTVADLAISSIDLVKRGEVRRALDAIAFDLLIVDEAHHVRPGTDRGALVADLAARVPWVVLTTATPHSGDDAAYEFLRGLGALGSGDTIATFRRSAAMAGRDSRRRVVFRAVRCDEAEQRLLDETVAYSTAIWREHHALVASVVCRRAVSSAAALVGTLRRRRRLLAATDAPTARQSELPWQESDERDAVESDAVLRGARLADADREIAWLDRLIEHAEASTGVSSKAAAIERLIDRTSEPAIVFSEYRDTVVFLHERLSRRTTTAVIHGGLSARERRDAVQQFVSGRARILLATDAAGEGLNLHERCRLVVNVELPWNPLRLEQRIGRVDRLGQSRAVHAIALVHRGSFEDRVLAVFEKRVRAAAGGLANGRFEERVVAAAIFDGAGLAPDGEAGADAGVDLRPSATAALRRRAIALVTETRPRRPPLYVVPRARGRQTRGLVTLFECDVHDASGRLVACETLPLVVDVRSAAMLRSGGAGLGAAISSSNAIRATLERLIAERRDAASRGVSATSCALAARLRRILDALDTREVAPVQTSLFDKRAEQRASASDAARSRIRDHIERRLEGVTALRHLHASAPRLIAVFPLVDR